MFLRHQRVILDSDIAELYGVPVRTLNQQLKRNRERFPLDFVFQLNPAEQQILRSQNVISSDKHGGRRYRPYAFTEHGAIMAATVFSTRIVLDTHDSTITELVDAIKELMTPEEPKRGRIGFQLPPAVKVRR